MAVSIEQLKQTIEAQHGCSATFVQSAAVKEAFDGRTVWAGEVHIFRLHGNLISDIAYAWLEPSQDGHEERVFSVLHVPPVAGPRDAVRATIVAER
jgi:hypothetical protein